MAQNNSVRDGRKPGWFHVDNDIIDHYGSVIGATGIAVYCALARYADRDGRAFPSHKRLSENLGIARNTLRAALRKLEEVELITITPQKDANGVTNGTTIYTLCVVAQPNAAYTRKGGSAFDPPGSAIDPGGGELLTPGGSNAALEEDSIKKTHDGDGDGRTLAFLENEGVGSAKEFAHLPYDQMVKDFNNRIAAGQSIPLIVKAWRNNPPTLEYHYERRSSPSDHAPNQPRRPKYSQFGSGQSDVKDPGWMAREIAKAERGEL